MFFSVLATSNDFTFTVARLVLGVTFFLHGAQKVLGWFDGAGFHGSTGSLLQMGIPEPLAVFAIAVEFFGGLGLILGLFTRIAALGIIANMLVAITRVHSDNGFFMNWSGGQNGEGFEYHLLAIGLAVVLLIKGSGAFSIDERIAWRWRKPRKPVGRWSVAQPKSSENA
ncbi:MAG: DoxX family protein [Candidatus Korobacteraceae bacterium]|jgi:putative oxidoreductase